MHAHSLLVRRGGATLIAVALASAVSLMFANAASAAIVANVPLGTSAAYSVLAGASVTNTGNTTMPLDLGLSPAAPTFITGFPPGQVNAPGVIDNGDAAQAQLDLTTAYDNAHLRSSLTGTTGADLSGITLQGGVYAATAKAALGLTGTLTLDGAGNPNTVFIFQTNSSLITGSGSVVRLINGAQECNVYWQVLSSATLGSGSTFVGNILALTSISMQNAVTVHGRALARNGSVTLINDHFTRPTCATTLPTTTTTTAATPPTTVGGGVGAPGTTVPTGPGGGVGAPATTVPAGGVTATTIAGGGAGIGTGTGTGVGVTTTTLGLTVGILGPPKTGVAPLPGAGFPWPAVLAFGVAGATTVGVVVRRRLHANGVPR